MFWLPALARHGCQNHAKPPRSRLHPCLHRSAVRDWHFGSPSPVTAARLPPVCTGFLAAPASEVVVWGVARRRQGEFRRKADQAVDAIGSELEGVSEIGYSVTHSCWRSRIWPVNLSMARYSQRRCSAPLRKVASEVAFSARSPVWTMTSNIRFQTRV